MSESPSHRNPALTIMLAILGVAIIAFLVALIRYINLSSTTPAGLTVNTGTLAASPSPSSTISAISTPSLTPRPSWTPPPSPTITVTITITPTTTRTVIPSLTPARILTQNSRYTLNEWGLAEASEMIELLAAQADTEGASQWYSVLGYAYQEALLRFPQAYQAGQWHWQLARSLIQAGDPQALAVYAGLIQEALETGQARPEDLPAWFQRQETELTLSTQSLPAKTGELERMLIQLSGMGNAFLWLIETPSDIQVLPLLDNFDPVNDPRAAFMLADLTGDGSSELIIYPTHMPGLTQYPSPWIFDLTQTPPVPLPMQYRLPVELGIESINQAGLLSNAAGGFDLQLRARVFPACPVDISRQYHWNGSQIELSDVEYFVRPDPALLAWCAVIVEHATNVWTAADTIAITEPLMPVWPPAVDAENRAYPDDELDAWRYRLGIQYALTGRAAEATQILQAIVDTPASAQSEWIEPAREFLVAYQSPEDLYRACQAAPGCNLRQATQELVHSSGLTDPSLALEYLRTHGVSTRAAGYFDFDGDGADERWVSILPVPQGQLEFWLLTSVPSGVQAVFVQVFEVNQPQPRLHDPTESPPVVQLELGRGFILERDALTGLSGVRFVDVEYARPTIIRDQLDQAIRDLFGGADSDQILADLLEIGASARFAGDCNAFNICARYYYTLGLVYELSGAERLATDTYLIVWRVYPTSPYALMARLKLYLIPATPTPTLTPTNPPTPYPLPGVSPSPFAYPYPYP